MPIKDREARLASARRNYANNPQRKQGYRDRKAKAVARNQAYVNEIKKLPCTDCGQTFPTVCMDFDHLPQFVKFKGVSVMAATGFSLEKIQEEIDKCELVCANCHRIRSAERGWPKS